MRKDYLFITSSPVTIFSVVIIPYQETKRGTKISQYQNEPSSEASLTAWKEFYRLDLQNLKLNFICLVWCINWHGEITLKYQSTWFSLSNLIAPFSKRKYLFHLPDWITNDFSGILKWEKIEIAVPYYENWSFKRIISTSGAGWEASANETSSLQSAGNPPPFPMIEAFMSLKRIFVGMVIREERLNITGVFPSQPAEKLFNEQGCCLGIFRKHEIMMGLICRPPLAYGAVSFLR